MDAFDDVRSLAASLLKGFPVPRVSIALKNAGSSDSDDGLILRRAELAMQRSGRADFADGVGRLHDILFGLDALGTREMTTLDALDSLIGNLEAEVQLALSNMRMAVSTAPIHGRLIALRYLIPAVPCIKVAGLMRCHHKIHS